MAGGVWSSPHHTTTFPTVLSVEPFQLIVVDRRAFCSRVLFLSASEKEGCCCGSELC
ncbi:hypothetical protein A2U01_0095159, partial [Trifolium medium]|nr:hypothetical protein [Trifolium medium]